MSSTIAPTMSSAGSPAGLPLGGISVPPRDDAVAKKINAFVSNSELFLRELKIPDVSNLSFEACGIPLKARQMQKDGKNRLLIWGTLGYLPFSVVSRPKRQTLISILEATHILRGVKFGVDPTMQIVVTGEYEISKPPSPDYFFVPLIRFLEESLPFIRLIGEYL